MAKTLEKEKAIFLRKKGQSIREISKSVDASKSSISYWCRDIQLSKRQINNLKKNQKNKSVKALIQASEDRRLERIKKTKRLKILGGADVGSISERDLFLSGLALYWGEGTKKGEGNIEFTNSDPNMIKFFIMWLKKVYDLETKELVARVTINVIHKKREQRVIKFWSDKTGIPTDAFTKTSFIKAASKKKYKNIKKHFGTLRIKVRKSSDLRRRMVGSIDILKTYQP